MTPWLFDKEPADHPSPAEVARPAAGRPRLRIPHRDQIEMHWASLDELLEADHPAASGLDSGRGSAPGWLA